MKLHLLRLAFLLVLCPAVLPAQAAPASLTIKVDSPVFVFSPGNWTGDTERGGSAYRETWYPGAYFRVRWTTPNDTPNAELFLDTSIYGDKVKNPPEITYSIDGIWTAGVKAADRIAIKNLKGSGQHTLTVYVKTSEQADRWGSANASGLNIVRVTGLAVDANSEPVSQPPATRWALIVGDSITEGSAADFGTSDNLASWGFFVGAGLQSLGYEYGISACGYSGWLRPGDRTRDVPGYYVVSGSRNGLGGTYDDARSRWNKIDAGHSLLDTAGHLSAYGRTGQEPSIILINYATNDVLSHVNSSDLQASITQSIQALHQAAPDAPIVIIVPFGQYGVTEIKSAVATCKAANPGAKLAIIDLGPDVARGLAANGYWSSLHPNMRGHATLAAQILAQVVPLLP
ncbi:MAG: SGNH/GDSL hydrolase family protein [Luteolibacter sp.]